MNVSKRASASIPPPWERDETVLAPRCRDRRDLLRLPLVLRFLDEDEPPDRAPTDDPLPDEDRLRDEAEERLLDEDLLLLFLLEGLFALGFGLDVFLVVDPPRVRVVPPHPASHSWA